MKTVGCGVGSTERTVGGRADTHGELLVTEIYIWRTVGDGEIYRARTVGGGVGYRVRDVGDGEIQMEIMLVVERDTEGELLVVERDTYGELLVTERVMEG